MRSTSRFLYILIISAFALSACSKGDATAFPQDPNDERREARGRLSGEDGFKLFDTRPEEKRSNGGLIGVNSFLWRASLDTLSFVPFDQVDPHGGVITTDWYEDPDAKGERFRLNVLILGEELRVDGLRVTVFKQIKSTSGWQDAKVESEVARNLEDAILIRARELRIKSEHL